jgi:hypothetical protein
VKVDLYVMATSSDPRARRRRRLSLVVVDFWEVLLVHLLHR